MLNKNILGVKEVRGQSEASGRYDQRLLISGEAKKLLLSTLVLNSRD